ncbi:lethal(2) giant larvae protein homolog 1-like isoform X2 [Branchiostoma floridae x Branchiostoma belcheri]
MLKFARTRFKRGATDAEREKLKQELFTFRKTVEHGFPHRPSAVAFDPEMKLLAIGTRSGLIKIYGQPGVEFSARHSVESQIIRLFFLPNEGRLISLLDDNSLHLWEVNIKDGKSVLEEVKDFSLEGRLKKISVCCLPSTQEHLFLGTEGGNIYLLDVKTFQLLDHIIYQDVVMQNVPDDYKANPGAVEAIAEHPTDSNKLLIGYNRGLIVLWDNKSCNAEQTYVAPQQLESLAWHRSGDQFMSAHADGSYCIWNSADASKPAQNATIPYGPFPCKAINKIQWLTTKSEPFIAFSGGMPRASYGDRHCVTVMQGKTHVVFDFTSRVVDFFTIGDTDRECEWDDPHTLVVLAEEELVLMDLQSEGWPTFRMPYLSSLHSSAITCSAVQTNVPDQLWDKITAAGDAQMAANHTSREWPIDGGSVLSETPTSKDLLLTGHEDGSVRFWDVSTPALRLLYKLDTKAYFSTHDDSEVVAAADAGEEDWPPFRKVGTFDPYSDDPRLGVQKILLCPWSGTLVLAGTAGQVVLLDINTEEAEVDLEVTTVNIVNDRDGFVWKGHDSLTPRSTTVKVPAGFQAKHLVQCTPPASVTALANHSENQLLAIGTSHGFSIFDYVQKKVILTKCTLNPNDLSATGESSMSRRKSLKKSLRESIRRLRKRGSRSTPSKKEAKPRVEAVPTTDLDAPEKGEEAAAPVQRLVEARQPDGDMASMVRCLVFAETFLREGASAGLSLWAGTNSGGIFVYSVTMPEADKREEEDVVAELGKEVQLKHRAPVVALSVMDASSVPLPDPMDVKHERADAPNMNGAHTVVIASEEQFKVFTLPRLKEKTKYKLTAKEGVRVRKVGFTQYCSRSDEKHLEQHLSLVTNVGDFLVFSIPQLRRQVQHSCMRKEDINGITSTIFTRDGEAFFLLSPSELQRCTLSARVAVEPLCMLELPEGARPAPPPEPEPEPEAPAEAEGEGEKTEEEKPASVPETLPSVPAIVVETSPPNPVEDETEEAAAEEAAAPEKPESEHEAEGVLADIQKTLENTSILDSTADESKDSVGDITLDEIKDYIASKEGPDEGSADKPAVDEAPNEEAGAEEQANSTQDAVTENAVTADSEQTEGGIVANDEIPTTKTTGLKEEDQEDQQVSEPLQELRITEGDDDK